MEYDATLCIINSDMLQALIKKFRKSLSAQKLAKKTKIEPPLISNSLGM